MELRRCPGIRLVVVGDGPERGWLEETAAGRDFTGMLAGVELATGVRVARRVRAHRRTNETFCQTIQEAQASGVPVVAPAEGGPLDLVEPGETGLLFDPRDPASLRDAVSDASPPTTPCAAGSRRQRAAGVAHPHLGRRRRRADHEHYPPLVGRDDHPAAA